MLLQFVVIELTADENAQEIFETLNARGTPLTAADLIKNFIFQRLTEDNANVGEAYQQYWKAFETGFWETEISAGRVKTHRSSLFLNHWLIAKTGEEILAREVFYRYKKYCLDSPPHIRMQQLISQIHNAGEVYREFIEDGTDLVGPISRLALFAYRTSVMESEVVKPLVLFLLDPEEQNIPDEQIKKAIEAIESWLVRRMLVRVTSKSYTQVISELIEDVRKKGRSSTGDHIENYLTRQTGMNRYWPDNNEVRIALRSLAAYRKLSRKRVQMVLEAIEDYERGWRSDVAKFDTPRVARKGCEIEHIMPQKWLQHWPLSGGITPDDRDAIVDTFGNLTLLTAKLNKKVSNGPWAGKDGKREALQKHDVLMLNRRLLEQANATWNEALIQKRCDRLIETILNFWKVPDGHCCHGKHDDATRSQRNIDLLDLINSGLLEEGETLYAKQRRFQDRTATVLADGSIDVEGKVYDSPSGAARSLTNGAVNGWTFWTTDMRTRRTLKDLAQDYIESCEEDVEFFVEDDKAT